MTYKVHGYCDDELVIDWQLQHIPRCGDTVRLNDSKYATVAEIIWCMDEDASGGQRVNLRMKSIQIVEAKP